MEKILEEKNSEKKNAFLKIKITIIYWMTLA